MVYESGDAAKFGLPPLTEELLEQALRHHRENKIDLIFPESGPFRRDLYPKHMEHFRAGRENRERCFMAGNRCGKSVAGAFETGLHLTGEYQHWWEGKRFNKPTAGWACGKTNAKTQEIVQAELFGKIMRMPNDKPDEIVGIGTGMVRAERIRHVVMKPNVPNAIHTAWVNHVSGGTSVVEFKSYEMGRGAFEGTSQDWIWLDEECPLEIYTECLLRTMTTDGVIYLTFTPLDGLTETVLSFLPSGVVQ